MRSLPRIEVVSALLRVSTDVWRWTEQRKGTQSQKCLRFRRAKAVWGSSQFFRMFARANYRGQQILAGTSEFAEANKFRDGPLPQMRNSRCGCGMYLLTAPLARYKKAHLQDLLPTHSHSAFPSKLFHIQHAALSSSNSLNECDMMKWRWWKTGIICTLKWVQGTGTAHTKGKQRAPKGIACFLYCIYREQAEAGNASENTVWRFLYRKYRMHLKSNSILLKFSMQVHMHFSTARENGSNIIH